MLNGCDVSYAQGQIDHASLAPSIDFLLVRRGYGTTIYDNWGRSNVTAWRKTGKPLGHWWYLPMPSADPLTLANVIAKGLADIQPGEPILLDVEEDSAELVDIVAQVALYLRDHFGNPPLVYLNLDFLHRYTWESVYLVGCGLWLAHWDGSQISGEDVSPFPFPAFKQWTCSGSLPGVQDSVCRDVFYGDATQFKRYGALSQA